MSRKCNAVSISIHIFDRINSPIPEFPLDFPSLQSFWKIIAKMPAICSGQLGRLPVLTVSSPKSGRVTIADGRDSISSFSSNSSIISIYICICGPIWCSIYCSIWCSMWPPSARPSSRDFRP